MVTFYLMHKILKVMLKSALSMSLSYSVVQSTSILAPFLNVLISKFSYTEYVFVLYYIILYFIKPNSLFAAEVKNTFTLY